MATTKVSQPAVDEEALSSVHDDPVVAYEFMLIVSLLYWLRSEKNEHPLIPQSLNQYLISARMQGEEFCIMYGLRPGDYAKYFDWVMEQRPIDKGTELMQRLNEHMFDLRRAMPSIKADRSIFQIELDMLGWLRTWHTTESPTSRDNAFANIRKALGQVKALPRELLAALRTEVVVPEKAAVEHLQKVVQQLTGKANLFVSMKDTKRLREEKPDLWEQYLAARKPLTLFYKQYLMNHVRDNGGDPMDVHEVRKHFEQNKLPHFLPPKEFKGKIGDTGVLFTSHGKQLDKTIGPDVEVRMNPAYDPKKDGQAGVKNNYYAALTNPTLDRHGNNNTAYMYTLEQIKANKAQRFALIAHMIKNERKMVSSWRKDLKGRDISRKILATMCELVYLTAARIGGKGAGTVDEETFGLSTLSVGNVKRRGTSIMLDYIGKKGVHQVHKTSPDTPEEKQVVAVIEMLIEGKRRADALWEYDGEVFTASKVNAYLKEVTGIGDATIHKLRHVRGTGIALEILPPLAEELLKKRTLTNTMVDNEFKAALTKVGKLLGHVKGIDGGTKIEWSTAAKNYVDVEVMKEFYESFADRGFRPAKAIQSVLK